MGHHALREQARKRLAAGQVQQAAIAQAAREEARIEQVQHGVLHPAHILIHGQPCRRGFAIEWLAVLISGEFGKVPAGICERVQRIGFARGVVAALRAARVLERRVTVERIAGAVELDVVGQLDRQLVFGNRHSTAGFAMDDGDRTTPIALPRYAPVAQAVLGGAFAEAHLFDLRNSGGDGVVFGQTVEAQYLTGGIHQRALARIGLLQSLPLIPAKAGIQFPVWAPTFVGSERWVG